MTRKHKGIYQSGGRKGKLKKSLIIINKLIKKYPDNFFLLETKADLLLTIGTSIPHTVIGKDLNNLNKNVQIISNDIDLNELNKKNLIKPKILFDEDCKTFLITARKFYS